MRRTENRDDDDNRYQQGIKDAELKSVLDPDSREISDQAQKNPKYTESVNTLLIVSSSVFPSTPSLPGR